MTSSVGYYTRQATGLVRDISLADTLWLNLSFMSVPYALLVATAGPSGFPGSNIFLVAVIGTVLAIPPAIMWGQLSQAMPRSGGDYVFNSRIIHPIIGFAASFSVTTWYVLVIALLASLIPAFGISAALSTIGAATGDQGLIDMATTVTGKEWQFGVGAAALVGVALLMSLSLRTAMRLFAIAFAISVVGVVIAAVLTLVNGNDAFRAAVTAFGGDYDQIIADAKAAGYPGYPADGGIDWVATIGATPLAFFALGYGIATAYAGGEVRSARSIMTRALLLALLIGGSVTAIVLGLAAKTFGEEWLGAATYLGTAGAAEYPFASAPFYFFFVAMLTDSAPLIIAMGISFILAAAVPMVPTFLIATRTLFAWSFDRLFPSRVSDVSDRTHSPLWANGIVLAVAMVFLALSVYGPAEWPTLLYTAGAAEFLTFIVLAVAAAIFPYRRKDLYEASPINRKLIGIPVVTLAGVLSLIIYGMFEYSLWTNDLLGANSAVGITATIVIFVIPFVIYAISYLWNRSRGVNLGLAFESLPPE
jgi:amino acid transporter